MLSIRSIDASRMRRLVSLTALLALLAAAPAADGATRWIVRGAGFGHGIGMSQFGAYGFAQQGRSYRQILAHYYRDTEIAQAPSRPVRVLLQSNDPYIRVRGASRAGSKRLRPRTTYVVRSGGGRLTLRTSSGRLVGRFRSPLRLFRRGGKVRLMGRAINGIRSGVYRGAIEVRRSSGGVSAVNRLPIDAYVQGVVPGEMPSSWHMEALKVQAVAARSYALATRKRRGSFDLYPDTRSQVYRGVSGETRRASSAVRATSGQILTHDGEPAVTYYFSTSGGHTENVENSFLGADPKPYLKGVEDPFDDISPRHRWRFRFSARRLARLVGVRGGLRRVRVLKRGVSPRVIRARFYGSGSSRRTLTGSQIRARLGLYDSWVRFVRVSTSAARNPWAQHSGWGASPAPVLLHGRFDPAPRSRRLSVERRVGRRWRRVATVRTTSTGRYRLRVRRRGVYRVRSGSVAGPPVRA